MAVTVNAAPGDLFVADYGSGTIYKVPKIGIDPFRLRKPLFSPLNYGDPHVVGEYTA